MLRMANSNRYPTIIDFEALPGRVNAISEVIKSLCLTASDLDKMEDNFVFRRLVNSLIEANIGSTRQEALVYFGSMKYWCIPEDIRDRARPG